MDSGYIAVRLAGRCSNGGERDGGKLRHGAINGASICGAKAGKRSVGFVRADGDVNCEKCLKRIEANNLQKRASSAELDDDIFNIWD